MTTGHVFIATSLDGFIARDDGGLDWLDKYAATGEDLGYDRLMESVDGLIMGRTTFEQVLTFGDWPYPKPVIVLSRTASSDAVPETLAGTVQISADPPQEVMRRVAQEGWRRAYIDGGKVVQSFVRAGLIDDLIITKIPILLGGGIPLFGVLENDVPLRHIATTSYPSGLVQSKYEITRKTAATR